MGMKLTVVREESQYEGALAVIAPVLEDIPAELHNEITREARKGRHAQKVRDIAGKMIGRVPAISAKYYLRAWMIKLFWKYLRKC